MSNTDNTGDFDAKHEADRQRLIQQDKAMHEETGDPSPYVERSAQETEQKPKTSKKPKK